MNVFARLSTSKILRLLTNRISLKSYVEENSHYNGMSCPGLKGMQEKQRK